MDLLRAQCQRPVCALKQDSAVGGQQSEREGEHLAAQLDEIRHGTVRRNTVEQRVFPARIGFHHGGPLIEHLGGRGDREQDAVAAELQHGMKPGAVGQFLGGQDERAAEPPLCGGL